MEGTILAVPALGACWSPFFLSDLKTHGPAKNTPPETWSPYLSPAPLLP